MADIKQNLTPFVEVAIDGEDITEIPPQHMEYLSHVRKTHDQSNDVEMTLFDRESLVIADKLRESMAQEGNSYPDIEFRYGWVDPDGSPYRESDFFEFSVTDWDVMFYLKGAELTLSGTSDPAASRLDTETMEWENPETLIPVIEEVVEELGYEAFIEPTPVLPRQANEEFTQDQIDNRQPRVIKKQDEDLMDFLSRLADEAVPKDDEDIEDPHAHNYKLYLNDQESELYFVADQDFEEPEETYIFEWNHPESEIIEWNPQYDEQLLSEVGTVSKNYALSIDPDTGDKKLIELGEQPVATDIQRANYSVRDNKDYEKILDLSGEDEIESKRRLANFFSENSHSLYRGELTIIGDGTITLDPYHHIEVLVYLPNGIVHHSSGVYRVRQVEDVVEGGEFTTTLTVEADSTQKDKEDA